MVHPHILVVDDSQRLREVLRLVLEREGYRVSVAASGREALAACRQSEPELVLLDVLDDGPGISPDNLPHVFERFFTTGGDAGRSGLGLALVKATVEGSGGG